MMAVGSRKISRDSTTDPSAELGGLAVTDFTPSADGSSWTVGADTSAVPEGAYTGAIVATDSNGTVSSPLMVNLLVDICYATLNPRVRTS